MDSGKFEATISGWNADFADPISFLDCMTSTNGYNSGKWTNKTYDKLVAESKTTSDSSKRMKLLAKAENTLLVDQGITAADPIRQCLDAQQQGQGADLQRLLLLRTRLHCQVSQ